MKKCISVMSIVLVLTLLVTSFTSTVAFAEETTPTTITFTDGFDTVTTLEAGTLNYYVLEVNKPELAVTAKSSDETVLKANITADKDNPGDYNFVVAAYKTGSAAVTFTASDGMSVTQNLTVQEAGTERNYTISSDTTKDFALPKGNSYLVKIHYESNDVDNTYPLLVTDEGSKILKVEQFSVDSANNDYYFRVEAIGDDGETGTLYMSGSHYIPEKLCSVTIAENDFLRLDTTSTYVCNVYDSYRFVAYTNSVTPPELITFNSNLYTEYVGKVSGGYEYRLEALEEGDNLVQVSQNGETASFAVHVNYDGQPSVVSDSAQNISVEKGTSYTYKVSIMGGGEPSFSAGTDGVVNVQMVKKDGINYYCQVTAIGEPQSTTSLSVTFPDSDNSDYTINLGTVTVTQQVMKSDTNSNFSLKQGSSYQFKITNATSFSAGSSGIFSITKLRTDGNNTYYKITAIGKPGQQTGLYMSAPGQAAQKVCVVTVAPPITMKSDTNVNFTVKQGSSYMFKITGATAFFGGSSGVFKIQLVSRSGSDSYYRITAVGTPGQQTGLYMSASGYSQKVCVVTVAAPAPITITSDTNYDFSIARNSTYQFKLTAPGATTLNFTTGTAGVYKIALIGHTGSDFFYKITAIGLSGQETGLYASVPGQTAKKICKVAIK
jgi:S-ribosylhomocysteine lyase LuxS involved in autoinducer biosynthesis